jgi:hypothetical protein
MAKNEYKEPEIVPEAEEEEEIVPKKPRKKRPLLKGIHSVFDGTFLTRQSVIKSLPFIFYIAFLAVLYIGNAFYAEKKIMQIEKIKKELKELRSESISVKSNLMYLSKQSEVIKRIGLNGVKESLVPPYKIFVKTDTTSDRKKD